MRREIQITLTAVILAALAAGEWFVHRSLWYNGKQHCRARVVSSPEGETDSSVVRVEITTGVSSGKTVEARPPSVAGSTGALSGRVVIIELAREDGQPGNIVGIARDPWLLRLAALLGILMVFAGGDRGVRGLLILALVAFGVCGLMGPLIAHGVSPFISILAIALPMTVIISVVNVGRGTAGLAAVAGALGGVLAVLVLAVVAVLGLRMTGVYSWLTLSLWEKEITRGIDFPGLLAAGITLGAVGVVIDLATGVASAVCEVAGANPSLSRRQLFDAGMSVGRDVMGTELNTLVFAYVGANVGVLLLPVLGQRVAGHEIPLLHVMSMQSVAAEITQILVGTTGLVLTIPIAAFAAATLARSRMGHGRPTAGRHSAPASGSRSFGWPALVALMIVLAGLWALAEWGAAGSFYRYQRRASMGGQQERSLVRASVESVSPSEEEVLGSSGELEREVHQRAQCVLLSGPRRGERAAVVSSISGRPDHDKVLRRGDSVLLRLVTRGGGILNVALIEYSREKALITLAFVLLAVVILVGHRMGLRATAGLFCSGAIVYACVLAVGVREWAALPTFVLAILPLSILVFLILCGPTVKALTASLGAFGGVLIGGAAAVVSARAMGFSGLHAGDLMALRLFASAGGVDYRGLYVAGILLGVVGVAMDVAIAIASAATEVQQAKPEVTRKEVLESALRVGRNVMTPMVLALVFAYLGLNLPILILPFADMRTPLALFVNSDPVAAEAARILAGSIGVVATVPITAFLCAAMVRER